MFPQNICIVKVAFEIKYVDSEETGLQYVYCCVTPSAADTVSQCVPKDIVVLKCASTSSYSVQVCVLFLQDLVLCHYLLSS